MPRSNLQYYYIPVKGSEIRSAEEAEEEYVTDEDWHAGREELLLEPEEERVGAENGREVVDSGVHESKEEEDKMEKGEMEDEDSVADDDSVDDSDEGDVSDRDHLWKYYY